ncbi:hypothetical protein HN51_004110 [Arachis hypogaea]|uniref:WPP domain-associated protein n=2 Tax=Arachis TaxID=3817 RepID=A0A444WP94_ARAHY|nr:WPP domain-associated protein [Arachis duranensis]XP_025694291.1 WPP domain-associated protein [Arachis hypogaea]XP_025694292.1 WPP domain-associated protein [Arachis hypogaea]QHO37901.1 WPP domain-associated protein [Arachis hypogaea]RYQ79143.1 hypothetical protein Ahy_Scaffold6g107846 [Arachis hypogaea]
MRKQVMMESLVVMDCCECPGDNGKENGGSENGIENESLGDHILEEMESFWLDIDERLTISRMVSDSVIKGMVNAIEQQAAERIAQKELEVVELKKMLHNGHVGPDETKTLCSLATYLHDPGDAGAYNLSNGVVAESMDTLQISVDEKLNQLKKEINKIRCSGSMRRIGSGADIVGLGGILDESVPERWIYVDKIFESLRDTLDGFCLRMQLIDQLSMASLSEWRQEHEFRSEVERMVISNCIMGLQQDFQHKLLDLYDLESRNCFSQHKDISNLRQELNSIFKILSASETGLLISHGSLENGEEWCVNKRADHFHWKIATNHSSPSTLEENGKHEDPKESDAEHLDPSILQHLNRDELITHVNSEITKMKRDHESQVQEMTEENFRLRRELLNLKGGSSLSLKKDKDFDLLKKKIPTVISKLDEILVGNEKMHQLTESFESLSILKDRLDTLDLENHQLKDMLTDKEKEVKNLSSQLSAALEKLSQQHLAEKKMSQTIQKLEDDIVDANAGVSIIQGIYKSLFDGIASGFRCITEELHLKNIIMEEIYEIMLKEVAYNAHASSRFEIEDADMESTMVQGLLDINHIIFRESLVGAERALKLEAGEKEELKQGMLMLTSKVEEKEKSAQEAAYALIQEKQNMELVTEQLKILRDETAWQQKTIAENNKELSVTKGHLDAASKEIELYKKQICKLHEDHEQIMNEHRESDEERRVLRLVTKDQQDALTLIEAKEMETRRQMESTIHLVHKLSSEVTAFEARVNGDISRSLLRLDNMSSEFSRLKNKANILKTVGFVYKRRLETTNSNLAKAEAEVDLLGDEVDTLLRLLEKICIALDHYSPILKHYPGILETLELVRRELDQQIRKRV